MDENLTEKENGEIAETRQTAEDGSKSGMAGNGSNKAIPSLRILAAVYVLYLAYGLIRDFEQTAGSDRIWIAAAIVVFVAAGAAILIDSLKKLIRKDR